MIKKYHAILLCCFFTGSASVSGKLALSLANRQTFMLWMFSYAAGIGLILNRRKLKRQTFLSMPKQAYWGLLVHCILLVAAWHAFSYGLANLDPTVTTLVARIETVFLVVIGGLIFRETLAWNHFAGIALAFCGLVVMESNISKVHSHTIEPGVAAVVAAAMFFALAEIFAKFSLKHLNPAEFTIVRNILAWFLFSIVLIPTGETILGSWDLHFYIALTALCAPILGRYFYMAAIQTLPISTCSLIAQLTPLSTMVVGFLVFKKIPASNELFGGMILIAGCWFSILKIGKLRPIFSLHKNRTL